MEKWSGEKDENGEPIIKQEEKSLRRWLKLHIVCGTKTNVITAPKVTNKNSNDYQHLPELLEETKNNGFTLTEVSADKGYSGDSNIFAVIQHDAAPYIMFKDNATGGIGGIFEAAFNYFETNQAEFKQHYYRRSNVETTFHMLKSKFGAFLMGKNETAQVNEILCKVLAHNICCLNQSSYEYDIDLGNSAKKPIRPALRLVK